MIPHAKKKYQLQKKTQLGDPSFCNCGEEPLASERICDAHEARFGGFKTPRFVVARFDKFGGKTVLLGVAISVCAFPPVLLDFSARWCNIFLDILSVVWFA